MKNTLQAALLTAVTVLTLAAPAVSLAADKPTAKKPAATKPTVKKAAKLPAKAVCVVCAAKSGKQELEPVHSSINYKGRPTTSARRKTRQSSSATPPSTRRSSGRKPDCCGSGRRSLASIARSGGRRS